MNREAITDAVLAPSVVTNPTISDTPEPATPQVGLEGFFCGKHTNLL